MYEEENEHLKYRSEIKKKHSCKCLNWFGHVLVIVGIVVLAIMANWYTEFNELHRDDVRSAAIENIPANETLAVKLVHEVRIFCWAMTTPKNHRARALHVKKTWGKRCNRIFFVTSATDDELDTIVSAAEDVYDNLWEKVRDGFKYIWENHKDEFDWILKCDDDGYVFVENLRYFLYSYSPDQPLHFGHNFKVPGADKHSYMSGGCGYILSHEAVRRFVEIGLNDTSICPGVSKSTTEDIEIAICLYNAGTLIGDSRDAKKKLRFLPFGPHYAMMSKYTNLDFWYYQYVYYHPRLCHDCLSEYAVGFHYISAGDMHMYEYFNYEFELFDENPVEIVEALPRKLFYLHEIVRESDNAIQRL